MVKHLVERKPFGFGVRLKAERERLELVKWANGLGASPENSAASAPG